MPVVWGFPRIKPTVCKHGLLPSSPHLCIFSFCSLIALTRTSSTGLNTTILKQTLFGQLRASAFNLMLWIFPLWLLLCWSDFQLLLVCRIFLSWEWVGFCQICFLLYLGQACCFSPRSVKVIFAVYQFSRVRKSLQSRNNASPFSFAAGFALLGFVEELYISVLWGILCLVD